MKNKTKEIIIVKDLIRELKHHDPNSKVVVENVDRTGTYIGQTPFDVISHIYSGFDWEQGFVYIVLNKTKTKEIKADWEQKLDELFDWVGYFGEDSDAFEEVKDFIKKNFVAKGEVREMLEGFSEYLNPWLEKSFRNPDFRREIIKTYLLKSLK